MSKKLIAIIVIGIALTVGFVMVAVGKIGTKDSVQKEQESTIDLSSINNTPKTAALFFSPLAVTLNPRIAQTGTVNVMVNTGGATISGAQLELRYDPTVLTNVQITPAQDSFFGTPDDYAILYNEVDQDDGEISFAVAVRQKALARNGSGAFATISFSLNPSTTAQSTTLSFAPTTLVTQFGSEGTVLKEASGLSILVNSNTSLNIAR